MRIPRKVLVVDDESIVTMSCRRILGEAGYEVHTAGGGREGMKQALLGEFDLVMTDLKMPDLDGMDLVRTLRNERPDMAIIIITGYGTVPSAVEATRLGVSDYVEKPFTPDQLTEAVSRAMDPSRENHGVRIEADLVKEVLRYASQNQTFGELLLSEGSRILSGYSLSPEAKAAIGSGDIAWIEKECGQLSAEEREWIERRLEAESF